MPDLPTADCAPHRPETATAVATAGQELLDALREYGVPGGRVWNAYWNLHEEIHHDGLGKK